jgi:hypothetical protein
MDYGGRRAIVRRTKARDWTALRSADLLSASAPAGRIAQIVRSDPA